MDKHALVSVLITVYNGAPYLAEAIESALGQTYSPVEVVVVDDASDDGSGDVARRYPLVRCHTMAERGGIGRARNQAVAMARGDLYTFLDADDWFPPEKLATQVEAFAADPDLQVCYGHVREFVSPDVRPEDAARIRPPVDRSPSHLSGVMLIRSRAFHQVGLWQEGLRVGTGVQWYMRSAEQQFKTVILDDVLLERRLHLSNNGLREADHRVQYVSIVKAALDRRRANRPDA